jgi:histidinol-phosphate aminotransferase
MSKSIQLARPEIRELVPYSAANYAEGLVRLNANETPWSAPGSAPAAGLNRYPPEKPVELAERLARFYGVGSGECLPTRGSSEAIDLLIRGFCAAGQDAIVVCPPTFGMYRVYADIQGARVHEIPLLPDHGYALDADTITRHWPEDGKLLFLCSPNNPTGNRFPADQLNLLATLLSGRALVVIDAAYTEFGAEDPTLELLRSQDNDNIIVLRTLSKAFGLAGARCGAMLGPANILAMLSCLLPPYAFSSPTLDTVLASLTDAAQEEMRARVATLVSEREWLAGQLGQIRGVKKVWPSDANFLLVSVSDADAFQAAAEAGGVLVRNFGGQLPGCLRITVGERSQNEQLIGSLAKL